MKEKTLQNGQYLNTRNKDLIKHYKKAIGAPGGMIIAAVLALEALCFAADLMAFGMLFGQVMGDVKGMIAAGSISLLFPLVAYFGFRSLAPRFVDRAKRERLTAVLLIAMTAFLIAVLVVRFPLEATAVSDEGASWLITAVVYCLPPISSVIGAFAASLVLHNPEVEAKVRTASLRARISNVKAELASHEGNNPEKLRQRVNEVYQAAFCEIDGMVNSAMGRCIPLLVARHGMDVHDYIGSLSGGAVEGTARFASRPQQFAPPSAYALDTTQCNGGLPEGEEDQEAANPQLPFAQQSSIAQSVSDPA